MSVLLISVPPRARLSSRGRTAVVTAASAGEVDYVLSADGAQVTAQGCVAPSLLPRADRIVMVLAPTDVAWHSLTLPRAPAARMRQALQGVLEDTLLDDITSVHCALPPRLSPGHSTWVAVVNRPWLAGELARVEASGRVVDQVVPAGTPDDSHPCGHFYLAQGSDASGSESVMLSMTDAQGHAVWPLAGTGPRQRWLNAPGENTIAWTASPAAAAAAEAWLGAPVQVLGDTERLLIAARSPWNLRQFELAASRRGLRSLRDLRTAFFGPAWRPVRYGLVGLVALQLIGLNLWAYAQQRQLAEQRQAMVDLLKTTFPKVRAVLDAPLQMARETDLLRVAAGRPGDADLESLLAAAASGWNEAFGPMQGLRFENATLSIAIPGWDAARIDGFRQQLQGQGWAVTSADGWLTLARATVGQP